MLHKQKVSLVICLTAFSRKDSPFLEAEKVLKNFFEQNISSQERGNYRLRGPIFLPNLSKLFTLNRSHYVHKKARDQFQLSLSRRLWILEVETPSQSTQVLEDRFCQLFTLLSKCQALSFHWTLKKEHSLAQDLFSSS